MQRQKKTIIQSVQNTYLVMTAHDIFTAVYEGVIHLDYLVIAIKQGSRTKWRSASHELCIFCSKLRMSRRLSVRKFTLKFST